MRAAGRPAGRRGGVPIGQRGPGFTMRPDRRTPSVVGAHQPGIATPLLDHLRFTALDLTTERVGDLRALLVEWSAEAERGMAAADGLTVCVGLGPGVFDERFGLRPARPVALRELPAFAGDALEARLCGGDLCVNVGARAPQAARAASDALVALARGTATVRWARDGFHPRDARRDPPAGTPRNLLGFKDGSMNLRRPRDLERHVWAGRGERSWMAGGTHLVVRHIRLLLDDWGRLAPAEQERVIGRHRVTGAPLGGTREFDPVPVEGDGVPASAHARLAAPRSNGGATMLRRSYSSLGEDGSGLLFCAYARDPARQFVPVQRRLAEADALRPFARHVGSAVFAIPPGARPGGFLAESLIGAGR